MAEVDGIGDRPGEVDAMVDPELLPRVETVRSFEEAGYTVRFEVTDDALVRCGACEHDVEPEEVRIDRTGRYEGLTNPSDEELLLAVTCTRCDHQGTLTVAYGTYASASEAEVVRRLPDARDR